MLGLSCVTLPHMKEAQSSMCHGDTSHASWRPSQPAALHSALHHTSVLLLSHSCFASFSHAFIVSIFPEFFIWCLLWMLLLFPLLAAAPSLCGSREHAPASPSLTAVMGDPQALPGCFHPDRRTQAEGRKVRNQKHKFMLFLMSQLMYHSELCAQELGQGVTRDPQLRAA